MNTSSRNVHRFAVTVPSQPNTCVRFSFTPLQAGEVTIDITVGPPPDISSPSPPASITNPPQYSTAVCPTPRVPTDTKASASSSNKQPSSSETVDLILEATRSQRQSDLDEYELGSDEEVVISLGHRQLHALNDQFAKKRKLNEGSSRALPPKRGKV